jgi:hypothetical protein
MTWHSMALALALAAGRAPSVGSSPLCGVRCKAYAVEPTPEAAPEGNPRAARRAAGGRPHMPRKGAQRGAVVGCRGLSSAGLTIQVASASGSTSAASACARPARVPCTPGTAELSTPASFKFVRTCVPASPPPSSRPSATQPPSKHMHPSVTSRSHCPRIGACSCRNLLARILHNVYQVAAQAIPNHGLAHSFLCSLQQCHSGIDAPRLHLAPSGMLHCRWGAPWLI